VRRVFILALFFCAWLPGVLASVVVDQWTTLEGLPQNYVHAAAEDDEGYLWVATTDGLGRFDGRSWMVIRGATDTELPPKE
jgi:ligand-binding sensor domain-containing protein